MDVALIGLVNIGIGGPRKRAAEEGVPLQHLETCAGHRCADSWVRSTATEIPLTAHQ